MIRLLLINQKTKKRLKSYLKKGRFLMEIPVMWPLRSLRKKMKKRGSVRLNRSHSKIRRLSSQRQHRLRQTSKISWKRRKKWSNLRRLNCRKMTSMKLCRAMRSSIATLSISLHNIKTMMKIYVSTGLSPSRTRASGLSQRMQCCHETWYASRIISQS